MNYDETQSTPPKKSTEWHIDWKRKLTSRKLWMAIAAFVSGLIIAAGGSGSTASTVSGCILQGAAVIGYLFAEGLADSSHTNDGGE